MSDKLNELKKEATELGITFSPNIGEAKLQTKIDEFYESKETASQELEEVVEQLEKEEEAPKKQSAKQNKSFRAIAKELEREARKTRVVTIIDNDQRINNQATSCIVNCSNEFFDLGTRILPLNEKVEVRQGHIDALKSVYPPQHMRDTTTGLSRVSLRPRYSIVYEDVK